MNRYSNALILFCACCSGVRTCLGQCGAKYMRCQVCIYLFWHHVFAAYLASIVLQWWRISNVLWRKRFLFTSACVQSKGRNKFYVVYVSNPWKYVFKHPARFSFQQYPAVTSQIPQCWMLENQRIAGKSACCWFSSVLLIFQHFSSSLLDGWMLEYISSPSASTRVFQLWTLLKQGRMLLAEGYSCGCPSKYLEVRDLKYR